MTGEGDLPRREQQIDTMLDALGDYWLEHPYQRLGQLVSNLQRSQDRPLWEFDLNELRSAISAANSRERAATPSPQGDTDVDWLQQQVSLEDG